MRSVPPDPPVLASRTAIRDAAISEFAGKGFAGATVRSIAAQAGVSPALVLHHFKSKAQLRRACDEHIASSVKEARLRAFKDGPPAAPMSLLHEIEDSQPSLRYIARMLVDGSEGANELVDALVADAVEYLQSGVASGVLHPTEHPYERAVVLSLWHLGAITLHGHAQRLMGIDLLSDPQAVVQWWRSATEILTQGLFADGRWEEAVGKLAGRGSDGAGTDQEEV